jgi:hypothetical protein
MPFQHDGEFPAAQATDDAGFGRRRRSHGAQDDVAHVVTVDVGDLLEWSMSIISADTGDSARAEHTLAARVKNARRLSKPVNPSLILRHHQAG